MGRSTTDRVPDGVNSRHAGRPRRARRAQFGALIAACALVASGCGTLGLDDSGPVDATITTSAAPVANAAAGTGGPSGAIEVPTLQTGTAVTRTTPTPWQSLTTTAVPTTSEMPITAPATTRTVTFATLTSVTRPTIVAPTAVRTPAPDCFTKQTCRAVSSAQSSGGAVHMVTPPGGGVTMVLVPPTGEPTSVTLPGIISPKVSCSGLYCLVQGSSYGIFFGNLILVKSGVLRPVVGSISSNSALTLLPTSPPVVAGVYRFNSYGVLLDDSPSAARTWSIIGGKLAPTGCGEPYLYATPPTAGSAQSGPCGGTPRIHGYGPSSGNTLTSLSGFVTPSGNIACALIPGDTVACTAKKSTVKVSTCSMARTDVPVALRGLRVRIGRSGGVSVDDCLGYTLIGVPATKISYNRLAVARGFVCEVLQDGVTCTAPSGHGFSLSSSSLRQF
ncbi:MAG: hypothetical protein ABI382_07455 [Nakamurella sp.]